MAHSRENAQLGFGFAFLVILLFWSHENQLVCGGILLLLGLTAILRFDFDRRAARPRPRLRRR